MQLPVEAVNHIPDGADQVLVLLWVGQNDAVKPLHVGVDGIECGRLAATCRHRGKKDSQEKGFPSELWKCVCVCVSVSPGRGTVEKLCVRAERRVSRCCSRRPFRVRSCCTSPSRRSTAERMLSTCFCSAALRSSYSILVFLSCRSSASRATTHTINERVSHHYTQTHTFNRLCSHLYCDSETLQ